MILMKVLYWKSEVQFIVRKEKLLQTIKQKQKLKSGRNLYFGKHIWCY